MKRIQGSSGAKFIECTNPAQNKWRIRWDFRQEDNGLSYMEHEFTHRPSPEEVKSVIVGWTNSRTEQEILAGFSWQGSQVWLSTENQFNYKAAHDLAVQTQGATLPVTFKFGPDEAPVYHTFESVDELTQFYSEAIKHIQRAIKCGWQMKDEFNLQDYTI